MSAGGRRQRRRRRDANNSQRDATAPSPARAQSAEWNNKREGWRRVEWLTRHDPTGAGRAPAGRPHPRPRGCSGRKGERLSSMRRAEDLHAEDRLEEVEIEDKNSRDRDL